MSNTIDDIVTEVEEVAFKEFNQLDSFKPQIIYEPNESDESDKLSKGIDSTLAKLANSLNLDAPDTNPETVLDKIDQITSESQKAFDLLSSKALKTINSRARVKAVMAGNILMSRMADMISQVDKFDYSADPMNFLLLIEKYTDFIDKMDNLSKPYEESVDESLTQMSNDRSKEKYSSPEDEKITPAKLAEYVRMLKGMEDSKNDPNKVDES